MSIEKAGGDMPAVTPPASGVSRVPLTVADARLRAAPKRSTTGTRQGPMVLQARPQPLMLVFIAVAAGILADARFDWPLPSAWCAAAVCLAGWAAMWRRGRTRLAAWLLLLGVAGASAAWHHARWRLFSADEIGRFASETGSPVCLEAIAAASPLRRPVLPPDPMCTIPQVEKSMLLVRARRVRDGATWRAVSGVAVLTVEGVLDGVQAGDRLQILATMAAPGRAQNPGEADFAALQRRQRRLCRLHARYPDCVVRLEEPRRRSGIVGWFSRLRQHSASLLWEHVDPSRAGLAAALLLGLREELDARRSEEFFRTGAAHLLAISGQHVAILVYGLSLLMRVGWWPRRSMLLAAMAFVVLYALLTDARPPVVRAATLVVVMNLARWLGRQAESLNTLALAAVVVLMLNPTTLFDTGAQLSFVAVAALGWIHASRRTRETDDPLQRLIAKTRPLPWRLAKRLLHAAGRLCVLSAVVWAVTLPLVAHRFHLVSFVAPLVNPLVCLPMAAALFSGFGVLVLGSFSPPLAAVCGWVCDMSLAVMEACLSWWLKFPWAYCWIPRVPAWWVASYYAAWGLWAGVARDRRCAWWWLFHTGWLVLGAVLAFRLVPGSSSSADAALCTFISVGHGTSVLLELPDGKRLLYDAGHQGTPHSAARSISGVLWSRGIWRLDAIILSHADIDHYNAVPLLLERFRVDRIVVTPPFFQGEGAALGALRQALEVTGVPLELVAAGDRLWEGPGGTLTALHPPPGGVPGSDNANSLVLQLVFQGRVLLLPGDLEAAGLDRLLRGTAVDCDVAMAPHHGSQLSRPAQFAEWCRPEWIVISGGWWRDTSPAENAFARGGTHVLHTASSGAVRVTLRRGPPRIERWRQDRWKR